MKKLVILGAGGLARELADAVAYINKNTKTFEVLGYLDDEEELTGQKRLQLPVLGTVDWLAENKSDDLYAIAGVGDVYSREKLSRAAQKHSVRLATIIHPSALVGSGSSIEAGAFIAAGCAITVNVSLGKCSLVNMHSTIAHDVNIGDYVSIHPGARISGEVSIGDYALIGTQAVILNRCTIGKGAVVAMGAVVAHDVPEHTLVAGNPARVIRKTNKE